jgi:hypothetical protein
MNLPKGLEKLQIKDSATARLPGGVESNRKPVWHCNTKEA